MSTILFTKQRNPSNKLIQFLMYLSDFKLKNAQNLLKDFNNQNYYNHLQKLIKNLHQAQKNQTQIILCKYAIKQQERKIQSMEIKRQENHKRKPSAEIKQECEKILKIVSLIQNGSLGSAKTIAEIIQRKSIEDFIQEIIQYRLLKQQFFTKNLSQKHTQFTNQGKTLYKILTQSLKLREQINSHIKKEIRNCLTDRPIDSLPQHLFNKDLQNQFQQLVQNFRKMKNQLQNYQDTLHEKMKEFSKEFILDFKHFQGNDIFDSFLNAIRLQLKGSTPYPNKNFQQKTALKQTSNDSIITVNFRKTKNNVNPLTTSRLSHKKSLNNQSQIIKSQYFTLNIQEKLNQIYQALDYQQKTNKNFIKLPLVQKLSTILTSAKQLSNKYKEQIPFSIQSTLSIIFENNKPLETPQIFYRNLSDQDNKNENYKEKVKVLQQKIERLQKEVDETKKSNEKLVLRLKQYNANENLSTIDFEQKDQKKYNIHQEKQRLKEEIIKLQKDLQIKCNNSKNWQIQLQKSKKQLKTQKTNYATLQKKYRKLKQEFDQQVHQIQFLNQIYEERFELQPQGDKNLITQSIFKKNNLQKDKLYQQNLALRQQNIKLFMDMNKDRNQIGVGVGVSLYGIQNSSPQEFQQMQNQSIIQDNPSFIQNMRYEQSNITPQFDPKIYEQIINDLQNQNQLLIIQNQHKQDQITALKRKYSDLEQHSEQLQTQKDALANKLQTIDIRNLTHNPYNIKNIHLFPPGFIFGQSDYQQRSFLLQNLINYIGPIRTTRLLYRADPHNRTNFHNYIDKNQHVVLICKTILGKFIAGYSSEAFDPKGIQKGKGMILSLWSRKTFYVKQKKAISYDDYYIIYGNSELRVRSQEFKLFSNFGIANSYYNNQGQKVGVILGEGDERQVDLEEYQVYALDLWD